MGIDEIKASQRLAAIYLLTDWLLLALFFFLIVVWPGPLIFVALVPLVASRQHALVVLLHEAYHGNLGTEKNLGVVLGRWLCGFPLGISFGSSRDFHLRHHRDLNSNLDVYWVATKSDPDWIFPMSRRRFFWISFKDWLGFGSRTLLMFEALYAQREYSAHWRQIAFRMGFYVILFLFTYILSWDMVLSAIVTALWIVAKYTALVWFNRIRTISEHYGIVGGVTRNVAAGAIETFFFVPHKSGLHEIHHRDINRPLAGLKLDQLSPVDRGFLVRDGVIRQVLRSS